MILLQLTGVDMHHEVEKLKPSKPCKITVINDNVTKDPMLNTTKYPILIIIKKMQLFVKREAFWGMLLLSSLILRPQRVITLYFLLFSFLNLVN